MYRLLGASQGTFTFTDATIRKCLLDGHGIVPAMDVFGPLIMAGQGARFILICIGHFSRRVALAALARLTEDQVVKLQRDVWIPHDGVLRLILSDNGPQFLTEVLRNLGESIVKRKVYSTAYYPQGSSFLRAL